MSKEYLFRIKILNKKDVHPLESISYYSGENQFDILNEKQYQTTTSDKVIWNKIYIPSKNEQNEMFSNLPEFLKFRSYKSAIISNARNILWKNVSDKDIRPDSQFARLFQLGIPHFLSKAESIDLLDKFSEILIDEGMIVDASIHSHNKKAPELTLLEKFKFMQATKEEKTEFNDKPQDYSAFLMCSLRDYKDGLFVNKNRNWNNPLKLKEWRVKWVEFLIDSIKNAENITPEELLSWEKKLSIYPEYQSLKKNSLKM